MGVTKGVCSNCTKDIKDNEVVYKFYLSDKTLCGDCKDYLRKIDGLHKNDKIIEIPTWQEQKMFCKHCGGYEIIKIEEQTEKTIIPMNENGQEEYKRKETRLNGGKKEYYRCKSCGLERYKLRHLVKFRKGKK